MFKQWSFLCSFCLTSQITECQDYYVYVSEVLLQKVNSYHALFILPLEQSAAVTAALSDNRDKKTLQNSSGWEALWPFLLSFIFPNETDIALQALSRNRRSFGAFICCNSPRSLFSLQEERKEKHVPPHSPQPVWFKIFPGSLVFFKETVQWWRGLANS